MSEQIATLPRNNKERSVVSLNEFKGRHYLDMRIFVAEPGDNGGEPKEPTLTGQEGGAQRKIRYNNFSLFL